MIDLLQKEISDCLIALQQSNRAIDNYRCYSIYKGEERRIDYCDFRFEEIEAGKLLKQ